MTILFDIFPATGHYNASFAIADRLQSAGHRIIYCGEKGFEQTFKSKGFEYIPTCSRLYPPDKLSFSGKCMSILCECFVSIFTRSRQKQIAKNANEFAAIVRATAPDFVVLDAQLSLKTIVYRHLAIPMVLLETMPLSLPDPWVPPFTSEFIPNQSLWSKFKIQFLWQSLVWKRKFYMMLFALLFSGQDYFSLHRKLAVTYGLPFKRSLDFKRAFITGIKGVSILAMTPGCFDFPRKYTPNCYFAESRVDARREEVITNRRYLQVIERVRSLKAQQPDTRLIYCSLGTILSDSGDRYKVFFRKMKKVCLRNPHYIFVMSVGMLYDITCLLPLPANVYVFQKVPQLDMLAHCDIMLTHGGMNSIAECIRQETPMLVFPLSLKWDQPGNSARVAYHGLGLQGDIRKDSPRQIEKKLDQLMCEYIFFKQNLAIMKQKMFAQQTDIPSWWELLPSLDFVA